MKGFIIFLLGCVAVALAVCIVVLMVDTYPFFYIISGGWIILAAFLVLSVLLLIVRKVCKKKFLNYNLETNEEYKAALEEDRLLKEEYDRQVEAILEQKREELRSETEKSNQYIQNLEQQIKMYEEKVDSNPVLHNSDKSELKVYRLIDFMESRRADSVKEALRMDDAYLNEVEERKERQRVEREERRKAEEFRRKQQERLDRMEEEQKQYHDKMIEEQEKQNEELRKLNGYK